MTPDEFKEARLKLGFTSQQALADEWGYDRVTIARWETGKRSIPPLAVYAFKIMAGND